MLPIPTISGLVRSGVIDLVLSELQLIADVGVKCSGERPGDRSVLWIVLCVFAEQVVAPTRKTRVEAAGGQAAAALQFLHELWQVDAQVGFDEIVFVETGEAGKLFRNGCFFRF